MDYKITFEDDSSGYLVHYGVKGMKWGEWNAETQARYQGGKSDHSREDHDRAVVSGSVNAGLALAKTGGNVIAAGAAFSSAYVASRAASKAIRAGRPLVDKLVKDPAKKEKAQQRFEDRVNSAAEGSISAATTFALTGGNVALATASFGVTYASSRVAKKAARAGRPLVDKVVKNQTNREVAYKVTEIGLKTAVSAGLNEVGSTAVNMMLQGQYYNSMWNSLKHYGVKGMKWGVWNEDTKRRHGLLGFLGGGGGSVDLPIDAETGGGGMLDLKDREMTEDEDMAEVNKSWDLLMGDIQQMAQETDMKDIDAIVNSSVFRDSAFNCATCSMVYDLRRRGYDVGAGMTTSASMVGYRDELESFYDGIKVKTSSGLDYNFDRMQKDLRKEPDGARGIVWGITTSGTGHAVAWSKEKGKLVYRDCQSNTKYDEHTVHQLYATQQGRKTLHHAISGYSTMGYARLDNATPNLKKMYSSGMISKPTAKKTVESRAEDAARQRAGEMNQLRRQKDRTTIKLPFVKQKDHVLSDTATVIKETAKAAKAAQSPETYAKYEREHRVRIG